MNDGSVALPLFCGFNLGGGRYPLPNPCCKTADLTCGERLVQKECADMIAACSLVPDSTPE